MFNNLVILSWYVMPILVILCAGAFFGDRFMDWQDARAKLCFYGLVKAGICLKPRVKKSKLNSIIRNMLQSCVLTKG